MLGLVISIAFPFILYKMFENDNFGVAVFLKIIINFLSIYFGGITLESNSNPGVAVGIIVFVSILLIMPIASTFIEYIAFQKTRSFFAWYVLSIILELATKYGFIYVLSLLF